MKIFCKICVTYIVAWLLVTLGGCRDCSSNDNLRQSKLPWGSKADWEINQPMFPIQ